MRYFYADTESKPVGPYTLEELRQLHLSGTVKAETWVVEEGGADWKPYTKLAAAGSNTGAAVPPAAGVPAPDKVASLGIAILWFICCQPIGFMQWGQTAKGWVWVVISIVTGGFGGIPAIIDYWMSYSVQQKRKLGEWEFFPRA